MDDRAFIAEAKESWGRVVRLHGKAGFSANALAVAAAIWATHHADRLIEIGERQS